MLKGKHFITMKLVVTGHILNVWFWTKIRFLGTCMQHCVRQLCTISNEAVTDSNEKMISLVKSLRGQCCEELLNTLRFPAHLRTGNE